MRQPYRIAEEDIEARASIGITYYGGGGVTADTITKQADMALYQAKHRGRNGCWVHQPETASSPTQTDTKWMPTAVLFARSQRGDPA